jgi:hypothetical protein
MKIFKHKTLTALLLAVVIVFTGTCRLQSEYSLLLHPLINLQKHLLLAVQSQ